MINSSTARERKDDFDGEDSVWFKAASHATHGEWVTEVRILWGASSLLHVAQVAPDEQFWVGEPHRSHGEPDFVIGSDVLGRGHLPLVVWENGPAAVVPEGSGYSVFRDGRWEKYDSQSSDSDLIVPLREGERLRLEVGALVFCVGLVRAESPSHWVAGAHRALLRSRVMPYLLASAGFVALLLTAMYFAPPATPGLSVDLLAEESRMLSFLMEGRDTPPEEPLWGQESSLASEQETVSERGSDEGQAGRVDAEDRGGRRAVRGERDRSSTTPAIARDDAERAGVLAALRAVSSSWASAASPYESESAMGADAMIAMGALIGDQAGENFGFGGLGLRGTGRRGGNAATGTVGVGALQTQGGPGGECCGVLGGQNGRGDRAARVPRIRAGAAAVRGGLSSDVIRRVVRRNVPQVRACYETQLASRPDLEGRVMVSFIISGSGAVQTSMLASSTLGNVATEQCIVRAVRRWSFPPPETGGIVRVNYPFTLSRVGD